MSRFLDRTRNAQNALLEASGAAQPNPEQWVEVLRNTKVAGAEVRRTNCRKVLMTPPPDLPSLTNAYVASSNAMESYRILRTRLMRAQATQGLRTLIFSSAVSFAVLNFILGFSDFGSSVFGHVDNM